MAPEKKDDPGPSIKDKEMYEALRDDGMSKSKAAAISNEAARTSREEVGRRGGESEPYEEWTVEELRDRARELDIEGRSDMDKDELIRALRE
ncbi:MAG: Rho termination factor [Acidobacteria bacterium]|nr:MAG: Rho termination factor [Acidobacteriota bacterium]